MGAGAENSGPAQFLGGGGEAGALVRNHDWTASPLGSPEGWPQPLKTLVSVLLAAKQAMFLAWGPEHIMLYNDAYAEILGNKHPLAMGRPIFEVWSEIRDDLVGIVEQAYSGEPVQMDDLMLMMNRRGQLEETHFAFSYTPIHLENGEIGGFFCACMETTAQVLAERSLNYETERQRRLFDRAPGFITILSGPEHRFEFVNRTYSRLFGDRGFVGKTVREAFPELEGQGFFELLDQVYTRRERFVAHETAVRLQSDAQAEPEERFLDFIYEPVIDESGAISGIFCEGHDVTEAHLAREALRAHAGRQEFRLTLEERLRQLSDPVAIVAAASEVLGKHLRIGQVAYGDVDVTGEFVTIEREWNDGSYTPINGRHRLDDFGPSFIDEMRQGQVVAVRDVARDPRTCGPDALPNFDAISLAAFIDAPIMKDGRLVAIMGIHSGVPRDWTADEVAMVSEVAERAWAAAERARAEGLLRESEERARRIIEGVRDYSVFTTDVGGTIVDWTPGAEAIFRWPAHEIVGQNAELLFLAEDRAAGVPGQELATARAEGCAADDRWHLRRDGSRFYANGSVRPLHDAQGTIAGFIKIARDETRRRAVDERLRASEEFNRRILASSADCIKVLDSEARLEFMSEGGMCVMEVDDFATIDGAYWPEFWDEAQRPGILAAIKQAKAGGTGRFQGLSPTMKGTPRWWDVIVTSISGPPGEPEKLLSISRDVTATKQAELRLRELNETLEERVTARTADLLQAQDALRQSQKMEAMGQLTGGVAHDFNNLLTPIIGALDMLQRRGVGADRERRLIDGAAQSADRAKILVQRLLAFARRQPLKAEAVNVGALVQGMADLVASTTGPQIKVVVDVADELPAAQADPNQLEMAILNLSVNARDAMAEGGTLRISADVAAAGLDHPEKLAPGNYVRLCVADTGVGMDGATIARAVEPFFSTKGIGKGTGLGLSMVHGLASQLGGGLSISSKPGLGTNITLWLPVADDMSRLVPAMLPRRDGPNSAPCGLALLVDDEDLVRDSTADMLTELGYEVVEAQSGEEALRLAEAGLAPDVLVTDHLMPGMTGTSLAQLFKQRWPETSVLLISGYAEDDGVTADLARLTKPFRQEELAESLGELLPRPLPSEGQMASVTQPAD